MSSTAISVYGPHVECATASRIACTVSTACGGHLPKKGCDITARHCIARPGRVPAGRQHRPVCEKARNDVFVIVYATCGREAGRQISGLQGSAVVAVTQHSECASACSLVIATLTRRFVGSSLQEHRGTRTDWTSEACAGGEFDPSQICEIQSGNAIAPSYNSCPCVITAGDLTASACDDLLFCSASRVSQPGHKRTCACATAQTAHKA